VVLGKTLLNSVVLFVKREFGKTGGCQDTSWIRGGPFSFSNGRRIGPRVSYGKALKVNGREETDPAELPDRSGRCPWGEKRAGSRGAGHGSRLSQKGMSFYTSNFPKVGPDDPVPVCIGRSFRVE